MRSKAVVVAVAFLVGGGLGLAAGMLLRPEPEPGDRAFEMRARDYCGAVHQALLLAAKDLARADDPKRQRVAADRFMTFTTYHSDREILLCADTPPDMAAWTGCWIAYDYPCLEKLARAAARQTKQPHRQ